MENTLELNVSTTIGQATELLETLRYSLEILKEQEALVDEVSVDRILKLMESIQTTLQPFDSETTIVSAYPVVSGYKYISRVISGAKLFMDNPDISVEQIKLQFAEKKDIIDLIPYLGLATSDTNES